MRDTGDHSSAIAALKHALPYIRLYRGRTFVIKAGGAVFAEEASTRALLEQVGVLHQLGIRPVLVHGGGPQSTRLSEALGVSARFVEGRRVTDAGALEVATMVLNGSINTKLVATCRALSIPAVGLSGVDGGLVRARRRPPVRVEGELEPVDYGYVGDVVSVDVSVLRVQLEGGLLPVVSPLSADDHGTLLNINADTIAATLAVALHADKLVLVTDAPGILERVDDPHSLISYTDLDGLQRLKEAGRISGGMLPKVKAIGDALRGGVGRVHVISHAMPDSLLKEIFTNEGSGTMVIPDLRAIPAAEQVGGAS